MLICNSSSKAKGIYSLDIPILIGSVSPINNKRRG
jgi:hypothetical protein